MSYPCSFIFQNDPIAVYFQLKTLVTSNNLTIFWHKCKFLDLIFNEKVIFSLNGFFQFRPIGAMHGLFESIRFLITFAVNGCF